MVIILYNSLVNYRNLIYLILDRCNRGTMGLGGSFLGLTHDVTKTIFFNA
jgi:hypothetical protein